jgi:transposase-like protein
MRPSESGASSSGRLMPTTCDEDLRGLATAGILMKCSSRSMGAFITDGVQLIRMAKCWIFWSSSRRDKKAAKKFFRKLLKGLRYVPRVIITDKLKSYNAAKTEVLPTVQHCHQKYQNNRAENSHQPTRLRERVMRRFKSAGHAQRFLSVFGIISSHFRVGRHLYTASGYRLVMKSRFAIWDDAICV